MGCPHTYWNTSVSLSSRSTILDLSRWSSQRFRSFRMWLITSVGGASTSVTAFHSRSGCPSPTFLKYTVTVGSEVLSDTQPRGLGDRNETFYSKEAFSNMSIDKISKIKKKATQNRDLLDKHICE